MKRFLLFAVVCSVALQAEDSAILKSMKDELERSRKLSIPNLESPYHIEYTLDDVAAFNVSASLGSLLSRSEDRFRIPRVRLRVGSYEFDNGNYVYTDAFARSGSQRFTLDDDYPTLRRGWWLASDRAYKGAVEAIARKRAALKNITQPEALPDFWKAEPLQKLIDTKAVPVKTDEWTSRVRALSKIFGSYPEIVSSNVSFSATTSVYYMHNSEGTVLRRPDPLAHLQAQAFAYAEDGSIIRHAISVPAPDVATMPDQAALDAAVKQVADSVRALVRAPAGESYTGPVLFEGIAGPQIVAELLVPNLAPGRKPIAEGGRPAPYLPSELESRIGSRVLPSFLDVIDDPTQTLWQDEALLGTYEVDEEGVPAKPLKVIEEGTLKTFFLTRQPVRGFEASNGRARVPGPYGARTASASNLFVKASESVKPEELKAQLLKLVQERNRPYGIIVRRMDFPSSASGDEARKLMMAASQSGSVRPVSLPLLTYKVYPDGREELVRGLRFRGMSVRSFRDILAVSDSSSALHYLNNSAPFALLGATGYVAPVSVIAPSLLFEELELERPTEDVPNPPLVPAPPLSE